MIGRRARTRQPGVRGQLNSERSEQHAYASSRRSMRRDESRGGHRKDPVVTAMVRQGSSSHCGSCYHVRPLEIGRYQRFRPMSRSSTC